MSKNDPLIPWGYKGKIRLSQIPKDKMFLSLDESFRNNLLKMITENPTIGIGETTRPEPNVEREFNKRYKEVSENLDPTDPKTYKEFLRGRLKEYNGKIYRLKKGQAPSAVPSASWHTGGFAADLVGDRDLAAKIAAKYGLNQVTSTGETWHYQPKGTPDGKRVLDFLKSRYNYDAVKTPLSDKALQYINQNFASNAPYHSPRIISTIDALLGVTPVNPAWGLPPAKKKKTP